MSSSSKAVGLTGGIGCGKTTVLQEFQSLGIPCFISDQAARQCYEDKMFLHSLSEHFGPMVIATDGTADRKLIADIVFNNPFELEWLNRQIHPLVMADFAEFCRIHADAPYVIFESAILYEAHLDKQMDKVIAVYLDREERLSRLEQRDKVTREAIEARMHNQISAEIIMSLADFVVLNYEGNPRKRQVQYIDAQLRQQL